MGNSNCSVQQPRPRHRNLLFSHREKGLILNNKMLTNESISIAMQILKRRFPETDGLEDTTLGKVHQFSIFRNKFVQVLHDGGCHWVCVANFIGNNKCCRSAIHYYDSLNTTGAITKFIEVQICSFLLCQEDQLTIVIKPVQQQREINCGLFALAFATSLLFGDDPTKLRYDEKQMRKHLVYCLENDLMEPFPTIKHCSQIRGRDNWLYM